MKKFRVVFNEERCHYYDVFAKDRESAEKKAEKVYYNFDKEDKDVKFLEVKAEDNALISCEEI